MTSPGERDPARHPADLRDASLRLLEFHLVRQRLEGYTTFAPAGELALGLTPAYEVREAARRQEETAEARLFLERGSTMPIGEATDLRPALQRAGLGGILTGEELRDVHDTLRATRVTRSAVLREKNVPALGAVAENLPVVPELERELGAGIGRSGEVLDSASLLLKELRSEARSAYQSLQDSLERTVRRLERQGILQETLITQRNGRMVLLVKTEMKHRLPGIVHDVSDSGATIFVEPMAAVGPGNRWRELRLAEEREEERVIRSLSAKVEAHSYDLLLGVELLARLDLTMAKARYALAIAATAPTLIESERQYISLQDARHPLLEEGVVPVTFKIGDEWSLLLITGPNAGGKTVALKTLGLLTLMAQAGLQVPAREGTLSLFDGVYADIGDQQSIQRSLSTFSSHIQNLRAIMGEAGEKSLVLIDELGTSTDPEEGAALAKAILGYLFRRGITSVATTHQRDVATFVQERAGMMNASVELDPRTLAPTYRLTMGMPGRSYALTIASQMGLNDEIIDDAQALLSPVHQQAEKLLKELQEERHLAEQRHKEAEEALAQAQKKNAELDEQTASILDRQAEMMEETRHQLQKRVEDIARRLRGAERALEKPAPVPEPLPGPPVPRPPVIEVRKEVAEIRRELSAPEFQPPPSRRGDWLKGIRSGDRVYLRGVPRPVEVITPPDDGGTVEVLLGTIRARFPIYQLDRAAPDHTTTSGDGIYYARASKKDVKTELDLHGVRVEEALERIEGFLSDATTAGLSSVRVLHGVGTGALRGAIREYLGPHPLVKSTRRDESLIADSVTIVELG